MLTLEITAFVLMYCRHLNQGEMLNGFQHAPELQEVCRETEKLLQQLMQSAQSSVSLAKLFLQK